MRRGLLHNIALKLAVLAWLAQLALVPAHALVMSAHGGGAAAWCGPASDSLFQKALRLPREVRDVILGDSGLQAEDCAQACASAVAPPAPDSNPGLRASPAVMAALGLELSPPIQQLVHLQDARGPPPVG